jgi:CheY-like chemotaxis protein
VPTDGRVKQILLVDDDRDVIDALRVVLSEEGYDVATASNGYEALLYLKSHSPLPSLILLDVMMPVMDGYEFRIEQQRDPAIARIPVVVVTAGSIGERVAEMGVTGLLRKPFDLDRLLRELARRTEPRPGLTLS